MPVNLPQGYDGSSEVRRRWSVHVPRRESNIVERGAVMAGFEVGMDNWRAEACSEGASVFVKWKDSAATVVPADGVGRGDSIYGILRGVS